MQMCMYMRDLSSPIEAPQLASTHWRPIFSIHPNTLIQAPLLASTHTLCLLYLVDRETHAHTHTPPDHTQTQIHMHAQFAHGGLHTKTSVFWVSHAPTSLLSFQIWPLPLAMHSPHSLHLAFSAHLLTYGPSPSSDSLPSPSVGFVWSVWPISRLSRLPCRASGFKPAGTRKR